MLVISAAPNGDPEKGYINKSPGCKTSNYPQQDLNKFSCQLEFAYTVQSLRSDIMVKIDTSEATLSGLEVVTGAIQTWCSRAKLFQLLTTTVNVTLVKVPRITFHVMLYWYDYRIPCEPIAIYILCWLGSKSTIKDSLRTWTMSFFCCYPVSQIRQGTSTVLIPEQDFIADWTRARPISNFCGLVTSSVNKITSQGLLGPSLEFADSLNVKRLSSSYSQLKGERTSRRSLFAEYSKTLRCLDGVVPLTVNDILPTTGCFRRALDPDRKPEISNRRAKFGITNHKSTARYYVACRFYTSARCCIGVQALRKVFSHEGVPTVLVTDNGTHFTAKFLEEWLKGLGCRNPQSNGLAENFVRTLKSAIISFSPTTFVKLDRGVDNFLIQYRNALHSVTGKSPALLFKSRSLRTSLDCAKTADVTFFKGNDLRPATGIVLSSTGKRMFTILDLDDLSCHRRHIDQVEFNTKGGPATLATYPISKRFFNIPPTGQVRM
ncbi:hypothetical protein CLF_108136 [Clonorchis sinensis]|uniref:Integrase catalytic domain-containing protein n=1 Tax=Clonorchis sinensis TaxID=79923 RepID=G7YHN8_CLOSI|nr:hypothetical protein CLF_108136 [Clonorchis sinensis]